MDTVLGVLISPFILTLIVLITGGIIYTVWREKNM